MLRSRSKSTRYCPLSPQITCQYAQALSCEVRLTPGTVQQFRVWLHTWIYAKDALTVIAENLGLGCTLHGLVQKDDFARGGSCQIFPTRWELDAFHFITGTSIWLAGRFPQSQVTLTVALRYRPLLPSIACWSVGSSTAVCHWSIWFHTCQGNLFLLTPKV